MFVANVYDLLTTYILTPDLSLEGNIVVAKMNGGWGALIFVCFLWQVIYYQAICFGYKIKSQNGSKKAIIFSLLLTSIFPSYVLMKFLVGTDNLLSFYCSSFLHEHAVLNSVIKNQFDWYIDLTDNVWNTLNGQFVYWYGFIHPDYKESIILTITLVVLILITIKKYRNNN